MEEYTGQLVGGPDDGNLVTATVRCWRHRSSHESWLDGPTKAASVTIIAGWYDWDSEQGIFAWSREWPGGR